MNFKNNLKNLISRSEEVQKDVNLISMKEIYNRFQSSN